MSHAGPDVQVSLQYGQDWRFLRTDEAYPTGRALILELDRGRYRAIMPLTQLLCRLAQVSESELPDALASNKVGIAAFRNAYRDALSARDEFLRGWPENLTHDDREFITERVTEGWPHSRWASVEHPEDCVVRLSAALKERFCPWTQLVIKMLSTPVAAKGGSG